MNTRILRGAAFIALLALILITSGFAASRDTDPSSGTGKSFDNVPAKSTVSPEKANQRESDAPAEAGLSATSTTVLSTPTATYFKAGEQANWQVLSMGGRSGSSPSYQLQGTIGQLATGSGTAETVVLNQGFWQGLGSPLGCCGLYTGGFTGNTDCDTEGQRNLADVTRLIDRVYLEATRSPLCCDENGNVDGDPEGRLNLSDITRLIDHVFIAHGETAPCF